MISELMKISLFADMLHDCVAISALYSSVMQLSLQGLLQRLRKPDEISSNCACRYLNAGSSRLLIVPRHGMPLEKVIEFSAEF